MPVAVSLALLALTAIACTGSSVVLILDASAEPRDPAVDGFVTIRDAGLPDGDAAPAEDAPAPADTQVDGDGGDSAPTDVTAVDVAEDALDDLICPMVAGRTFVSQTDQSCGQGAPPCRWRMSVALDGVVTWAHDGVVEVGSCLCKGLDVVLISVVWDDAGSTLGIYDVALRELNVNGVLYSPVP